MADVTQNAAVIPAASNVKRLLDVLSRAAFLFFAFQFLSKKTTVKPMDEVVKSDLTVQLDQLKSLIGIQNDVNIPIFPTHDSNGLPLGDHECIFRSESEVLELSVYLTEFETFDYLRDRTNLTWFVPDISFGWGYGEIPRLDLNITPSHELKSNGSMYAHTFFARKGHTIDSTESHYIKEAVAYRLISLVKFKPKKKQATLRRLLDASTPVLPNADCKPITASDNSSEISCGKNPEPEVEVHDPITGYWKPTLDLSLVLDMQYFARNQVPVQIAKHITFLPDGGYYPVIYHNEFWTFSKQLQEINSTVKTLPLSLSYAHIAAWKWTLQVSMEDQWLSQQRVGLGTEKDADVLRETLLETSPWLLGITMLVSMLHMVFDILAFKNDIQFWRKKKNMEGMSVQSLGVNCFFQTIIFAYLFDNDTSNMILISSFLGLIIEYWKLKKAFNIDFKWRVSEGGAHIAPISPEVLADTYPANEQFPTASSSSPSSLTSFFSYFLTMLPFTVQWEVSRTYSESATKQHDQTATSHLLYSLTPLVFGYSLYSLLYISHKSYYSWALGSLVGFVYCFGFVLMTPQLFINYKLKSVAHMPWKAMVYKALNTFIDDLFAFVIKMPTLHRLSCFRDDLIFFIYLYQKWTYRVDYTRANEFGQGGEEEKDVGAAKVSTLTEIQKNIEK